MLTPSSRMSPPLSSIIRLASRRAVVLPHPDGPTSTQMSPAGTSSERLLIAGSDWPGYRLVASRYSTDAADVVGPSPGTRRMLARPVSSGTPGRRRSRQLWHQELGYGTSA